MEKHIKDGNLLTAEKYCNQTGNGNLEGGWEDSDQYKQVKKLMIEFAQLHVEAALKSASKNVKLIKDLGENEKGKFISKKLKSYNDEEGYPIYPDKQSILNAYDKKNIK